MNKTIKALLWGALGTLLFTLVFASSKLTDGAISAFQIMFIRYVSGFVVLLIIVLGKKTRFCSYASKRPHYHMYRSVCGAMGGICIVHASHISPIADVTAIGLTDGLITVFLSVIFLREAVGPKQWFGGLLCGLGALVVVYGSNQGELLEHFSYGLWLALLGAVLISIESILIKVLTTCEKALTILLHVNVFSMLITSIPALLAWQVPSLSQLLFFLALGPIAISAQYCWVIAYSMEDVSIVTPINYTWIVFAAVLGYIFFDEELGIFTIIGAALIVLGGVFLAKKRHVRNTRINSTINSEG